MAEESRLEGGESSQVHRRGDVVLRERRPWSETVLALLRHLHAHGFTAAPKPVGTGFAPDGREQLAYIEADRVTCSWDAEAMFSLGSLLRRVHDLASTFQPSDGWMPWWGRGLPSADLVIGHYDAAPWNILVRDGQPVALVDWDTAGPVGRQWDVAQTAWLNAALHDDDVAQIQNLPDLNERAQLLAAFADGYHLDRTERAALVDDMIEVAVRTAAQEAIDSRVTPTGTTPSAAGSMGGGPTFEGHELLWAVTWRVKSARWMLEHRGALDRALTT